MKAIGDVGAGHTLGRYELLVPIARGGMAVVWAARMKGTRGFQKLVAIKSMLPSLNDDDGTFEEMFLAEAQLAAQIRHPHVAEVLDLGEQEGVLFIVMEWVDGEPLGTIHKAAREQGNLIPIAITTRIGLHVAQALHAAHELKNQITGETYGLVHRDVSPQNILITFDGVVKVVDFGVAKATAAAHGGRTAVGQMKGKVTYMAPEQGRGEPVDRRADVFSLGIVLYQLVTNRHPFKGETPLKTLDKILDQKPVVPPITYTPTCHPALNQAIVRALEKDKRKRFSSMAEMAEVLEVALSKMVTRGNDLAPFVQSLVGARGDARRVTIRDALRVADERTDRSTVPQLKRALAAAAPTSSAEETSQTPGASSISAPGETSAPSEPSVPSTPAAPPLPPQALAAAFDATARTTDAPPEDTEPAGLLPPVLPSRVPPRIHPPPPLKPPSPEVATPPKRPIAATLDDVALAGIAIGALIEARAEAAPSALTETAPDLSTPAEAPVPVVEARPTPAPAAVTVAKSPERPISDKPSKIEKPGRTTKPPWSDRPAFPVERRSAIPAVVAVRPRKRRRTWLAVLVVLVVGGIAAAAFTFPGALGRFAPMNDLLPLAPAQHPTATVESAPATPPAPSPTATVSAAPSAVPAATAPAAEPEPEETPSATPSASASASASARAAQRVWRRPAPLPPPQPPPNPAPGGSSQFTPSDL